MLDNLKPSLDEKIIWTFTNEVQPVLCFLMNSSSFLQSRLSDPWNQANPDIDNDDEHKTFSARVSCREAS
jgi:hypothetical protein